ncbi:hypothetical protein PROFUN_09849 [Planoprotostelium fungivorum]|uniref:Armadillo-like helical domain-containing protein n=1 Tax=Planoprotostelium fungivorum TaxID=1890364 RepID=A0A2P6NFN5_9EUKA|nr:hypothetical protein PROFUN_09849 [Planoprotostelium fungivorum]
MNSPVVVESNGVLRSSSKGEGQLVLKEKFVLMMEEVFEEPKRFENDDFWQQLMLLKVNTSFIHQYLSSKTEEELMFLKISINGIFERCLQTLDDEQPIRRGHAMEIMGALLQAIVQKKYADFNERVRFILTEIDDSDSSFCCLLRGSIKQLSTGDGEVLHRLALTVLLILATGSDNINSNNFIEYFMQVDLSDLLFSIFKNSRESTPLCQLATSLYVIILNYRKTELTRSPYRKKLAESQNSDLFRYLTPLITSVVQVNEMMTNSYVTSGIFSRWTGYLGSWVGAGSPTTEQNISSTLSTQKELLSSLLFLYEVCNLNRNTLPLLVPRDDENVDFPLLPQLFTFCSFLFTDVRSHQDVYDVSTLCLSILCCLTDSTSSCAILFNDKYTATISMLTSKSHVGGYRNVQGNLASLMLVTVIIYIQNNGSKNLHYDLYSKSLNILDRLISYRIRRHDASTASPDLSKHLISATLTIKWNELWDPLFSLFRYILATMNNQPTDALQLLSQIVHVVNMFISYGEILLTPIEYDFLYAEIIRHRGSIDALFEQAKDKPEWSNVLRQMDNMKSIIKHYGKEFDNWAELRPEDIMTPEEVQKIVRLNYDTLRLESMEDVQFKPIYFEGPKEEALIRKLATQVSNKIKNGIVIPSSVNYSHTPKG